MGNVVVAGGEDGVVRIWNQQGQPITTFTPRPPQPVPGRPGNPGDRANRRASRESLPCLAEQGVGKTLRVACKKVAVFRDQPTESNAPRVQVSGKPVRRLAREPVCHHGNADNRALRIEPQKQIDPLAGGQARIESPERHQKLAIDNKGVFCDMRTACG